MNRAEFINLLENKVQINRQMLGEVYELLDIFPYFQSAHMILLHGLKRTEDVKFEKQLRSSSIHIADREVLYYFLNLKPDPVPAGGDQNEESGETEPGGAEQTEESREPEPSVGDQHEEPRKPEPSDGSQPEEPPEPGRVWTENMQTVIESAMNSEELISDLEKNERRVDEESKPPDLNVHSHSILISDAEEELEPVDVMMINDEDEPAEDYRIFYMDPGFSVPESDDLLELDTSKTDLPDSAPEEEYDFGETFEKEPGNLSQSELIDRFILANPRIEPSREHQDVPPADISNLPGEGEGGFVTETLAKIYINQGYYSKAIDIYEKLSLKFPEKSSYFASLIELVKVHLKK